MSPSISDKNTKICSNSIQAAYIEITTFSLSIMHIYLCPNPFCLFLYDPQSQFSLFRVIKVHFDTAKCFS